MPRPGYLSYRLTPDRRRQITALAERLHLAPDDETKVIDFALQFTLMTYKETTEMNTKSKIREALESIMAPSEANACNVFKGYDVGTGRDGWHFVRFGQTATYIGKSESEALEWISDVAATRGKED